MLRAAAESALMVASAEAGDMKAYVEAGERALKYLSQAKKWYDKTRDLEKNVANAKDFSMSACSSLVTRLEGTVTKAVEAGRGDRTPSPEILQGLVSAWGAALT